MSAIAVSAGSECLERLEDVASLYAAQAVRVRRLVGLDVQAPEALVEDACQIAWMRLVCHRARVRQETATRWVVRVAINEARKLIRHATRELSLDELSERGAEAVTQAPSLMDGLVESRARLDALRALPPRQRRLLWLQGAGFSYAEMAHQTGATRRTVERQLTRARVKLAEGAGSAEGPAPAKEPM